MKTNLLETKLYLYEDHNSHLPTIESLLPSTIISSSTALYQQFTNSEVKLIEVICQYNM